MPFSKCYLFQNLSASQIERIEAISRKKKIKKGQWLYREDDEAEQFYQVKEGAIELLTLVDETIEIPIAMIRPKIGCFGIGALIPPYRHSLSARSARDSTLLVFKHVDLQNLMRDDPDLGCIMMTNMAEKLRDRLKETRHELKIHFMNLVRSATF
jgi:CRP-like cAMP-binding protein